MRGDGGGRSRERDIYLGLGETETEEVARSSWDFRAREMIDEVTNTKLVASLQM